MFDDQPRNFFLPQYQTALGTVVHATPVVEALKSAVPDARVVIASSGLAAQVWQGNHGVEALVRTPNPLTDPVGAILAFRRLRLFGTEPFVTLLTTGNERTKITLSTWFTSRTKRVGFAVHARLVDRHLAFDPALSQIDNNLRLLDCLGVAVPTENREPRIYAAGELTYAKQVVAGLGHPRIVLATQSSPTQRKSWPQERWVELSHALKERYRAELIFVGTQTEAAAIDEMRGRIGFPTTSLAGQTSIQQLAAVLSTCDLGVMLDTGTLHVARAVGMPAVIIAPAWSPVHEWLPLSNSNYRILKNADFPPPAPTDYLITEVSTAEVLRAVDGLMGTNRPQP